MFDAKEHPAQQDRDRVIPRLDRCLDDRADHPDDAGIVEHDVESAELRYGEIDRGRDFRFARDVATNESSLLAEAISQRVAGAFLEVGDDDTCALLREALSSSRANPARRAGDHGHLAFESSRHLVSFLIDMFLIDVVTVIVSAHPGRAVERIGAVAPVAAPAVADHDGGRAARLFDRMGYDSFPCRRTGVRPVSNVEARTVQRANERMAAQPALAQRGVGVGAVVVEGVEQPAGTAHDDAALPDLAEATQLAVGEIGQVAEPNWSEVHRIIGHDSRPRAR
jgi:hypothetical protein